MTKKIALVLLSPLVVFLLVELGLRFYFTFLGTELDRITYVYSAQEIAARNPAFIGLPFVGYGPSDRAPDHNDLGYRGPQTTLEKPAGVYRIVTAGGSTTYGAGLGAGQTWPAQLQRILHEDYGLDFVEVINTASVAHTTWNSLANFAFRVVDLAPDLLIVYHSTNDAKARLTHPDCYSGQTPIRGLYDGLWRTDGPPLSPSVAYRWVAIRFGWMPNPIDINSWILPVEASDPDCPYPSGLSDAEAFAANPPIFFRRNLKNLVFLARANGVEVLLSTWAFYPPFVAEEWAAAFAEQNAVIAEVAEETDARFYDLMEALPQSPDFWYFDGEHQTARGAREQAALYAAYLVTSGLIPPATTQSP